MLHFDINPPMKHQFTLFRMLLRDERTHKLLKPRMEDNTIVIIYDDDLLCGGALVFGGEKPTYMYCFFENPEYCSDIYRPYLKDAIEAVYPNITLFDVENRCLHF